MFTVEARHTPIYHPPSATESEPVGGVDVAPEIGGCAIKTMLLGEEFTTKYVSDTLPLYGLRVAITEHRAIAKGKFYAGQVLQYDSDPFGYMN